MSNPPTVAILGGTGSLGGGLAARFSAAGCPLIVGSREAGKARLAIEEAGWNAEPATNEEAAARGDVVILTVPFAQQADLLRAIAPRLGDKLVIDTSVPLVPPKVAVVQLPPAGSAALTAREALGGAGRLVTAFHNVSAAKLRNGQPIGADVLVFGAVDDREEAVALIDRIGVRAVHGGPLENAVAAEAMTSVLIAINRRYKVADGAGVRVTGLADGEGG
ncbi:NADPH-dependent F420 reductase [Acuticoccus kandeliae]|uniref:NADPH-dependent F420 reductase n=1 Tax=Acuticoccus kandeliae TaxID=2073160 RepID=UPI000D3E061B|nr:NADPH-dependent F420 reductase [Acuticoccus kandeliae]